MNASELNKALKTRRRDAERELPALAAAYERILRKIDAEALSQFNRQAMVASPWQPPPEGNLLDEAAIATYASSQVSRIHSRIVTSTAGPTLVRMGISWDVTSPFATQLLGQAAKRTGKAVSEAVQPRLREIILGAYERGLSVQDAAALIEEKLTEFRPATARMLARTDLNGIGNGASVMAARMVGVQYKQWLTAEDDRVREQHVEADGQTVPVDQPFQVCGEEADYPGDPALSDECAANCRCTVVYVDAVDEPVTASANGTAQPVTVQVAAATTSPEVMEMLERLGGFLERSVEAYERAASTIERAADRINEAANTMQTRPPDETDGETRRIEVVRDGQGDIRELLVTDT